MSIETWFLFALTILVASVSPGPNVLIVMIHALKYGWRRAGWTIAGNIACLFGIAALAALGIGALIKAEPLAYTILRTAGAAYLIYMGIRIIRASFRPMGAIEGLDGVAVTGAPPSRLSLASQAFLVSASNPKSVIFLSAVFPQFLDQEGPLLPQFGIMFATIIVIVTTIHLSYAFAASALRHRIVRPRARTIISRITGGSFIALGGGVLVSE